MWLIKIRCLFFGWPPPKALLRSKPRYEASWVGCHHLTRPERAAPEPEVPKVPQHSVRQTAPASGKTVATRYPEQGSFTQAHNKTQMVLWGLWGSARHSGPEIVSGSGGSCHRSLARAEYQKIKAKSVTSSLRHTGHTVAQTDIFSNLPPGFQTSLKFRTPVLEFRPPSTPSSHPQNSCSRSNAGVN